MKLAIYLAYKGSIDARVRSFLHVPESSTLRDVAGAEGGETRRLFRYPQHVRSFSSVLQDAGTMA